MRFIAPFLTFIVLVSASAIPHFHEEYETSPVPRSPLEARDSYDCQGSGMCKSLQVRACDKTVNDNIIRNNDVNYGAPGSGRPYTGACSAIAFGDGCGVFIQGKSHCARSGNEIWWDYQDIRKNNCKICGSKHWGDGCYTTINYVTGCST